MSDSPNADEIGRRISEAFSNTAEAMRKFAEVWNDGPTARSAPLLSVIMADRNRKPTA